jgi:chromosome segregation ATPase
MTLVDQTVEVQDKLVDLLHGVEHLQHELESKAREIEELKNDVGRLEQYIEDVKAENFNLHTLWGKSKEELDKTRVELGELKTHLKFAKAAVSQEGLKNRVTHLEDQLAGCISQRDHLIKQKDELRKKLEDLETGTRNEHSDMALRNRLLREENENLHRVVEETRYKWQGAHARYEKQKEYSDASGKQRDAYWKDIERLTQEVASLRFQCKGYKEQLSSVDLCGKAFINDRLRYETQNAEEVKKQVEDAMREGRRMDVSMSAKEIGRAHV